MPQKILVFENDSDFAGELKVGFEQLGAEVEVVNDGPTGLERAAEGRPDVILLTIELPGMNGFLVCKKIKKSPGVQDIPLIILSSEASEETFEQHKKLRTRAEEYLRKPIAFDELLEKVKQFVPLGEREDDTGEFMEIEDDETTSLIIEESISPEALETAAAEEPGGEVVETLEMEDEEELLEIEDDEQITGVVPEPEPPRAPPAKAAEPPSPAAPSSEPPPKAAALEADDGRQAQIQALQTQLDEALGRAEVAEKMLKEKAAAGDKAAKSTGVSGREFLDLKEQLNRKDRELLDLRDQLSVRDKQIIELRDENLKAARESADLKDNNLTLERDLGKSKEVVEALKADKEGSKKRIDDMKARLERSEAKGKEYEQKLDEVQKASAAQVEQMEAQMANREAELEQAKQSELEQLRATLGEQKAGELEAKETEHKAELGRLHEAHEKELESTRESYESKHAAELEERQQRHNAELEEVRGSLAETQSQLAEAESRLGELEQKLAATEENSRSLERTLNKVTEERNERSAEVLSARDAITKLDEANKSFESRVADLEDKLALATDKIGKDEALLGRVRKAMAIGLGLLEEQKQNEIEL